MPSVLEAFRLNPLATQSANRGLAKRLMAGTLRPPEQAGLERCALVLKYESEGLKYPAIAELIGLHVDKLRKWTQSNTYQIFSTYLAERSLTEDDQAGADRRRANRRRFETNEAKALDYIDQAFRRHTRDDKDGRYKQGDYIDMDRAERMTQLVAKSAGWTEPLPGHAKPKELKVGVIQGQMQAIAAADRRETVVRITETAQGTSIEVGSRETAALGGEG